jgi:hypothetical protein
MIGRSTTRFLRSMQKCLYGVVSSLTATVVALA